MIDYTPVSELNDPALTLAIGLFQAAPRPPAKNPNTALLMACPAHR